jgi:hypothetical protein
MRNDRTKPLRVNQDDARGNANPFADATGREPDGSYRGLNVSPSGPMGAPPAMPTAGGNPFQPTGRVTHDPLDRANVGGSAAPSRGSQVVAPPSPLLEGLDAGNVGPAANASRRR